MWSVSSWDCLSTLERPPVKAAECPECDSKAGQESSKDREPYDSKTVAGVGVAVIVGSWNTESQEANETMFARGAANNITSEHRG